MRHLMPDVIVRADIVRLREEMKGQQMQWVAFMKTLPLPLLLVLRNQNYTRALCQELGNPVNRFRIMVLPLARRLKNIVGARRNFVLGRGGATH